MNGPADGGGFLARLRQNETVQKLSGGRPDLVIFGAPVAVIAVIAAVVIALVSMTGGSSADNEQVRGTATPQASATVEAAPTGVSGGQKTEITFSDGAELTDADLALRGPGEPVRGAFTGERLVIPRIGVDAPFTVRTVGPDGQMPNPSGPWDVAWYDFSQWPGLGGLPNAGGNVILAGHVDYINVGPAVFWDIDTLVPGDIIQLRMQDGTVIEYAVEFNKWVDAATGNWDAILAGTGDESITLITCVGQFSQGKYDKRQIVWGRRVA